MLLRNLHLDSGRRNNPGGSEMTDRLTPEEAVNDFDTLAGDLLDEIQINVAAGYMTSAIRFYIGQMRRLYQEARLGQEAVASELLPPQSPTMEETEHES
jgi:hypothetical protein